MTSGVTTAARRTGIVVLLVLATLFWAIGGFAIWANRQMLNTDNWVDASDELLDNDEIRGALSQYLVDQLYQDVDVVAMSMPNSRTLVMGGGFQGHPSSSRVWTLSDDGKEMIEFAIRHLPDGTPYMRKFYWKRK